ncbi:MAG: hypothetical protein JXB32_03055 [Deltaproteobacteria bacterium]|nr:hypothetical protein [Deltaproteobacteria bacterium]
MRHRLRMMVGLGAVLAIALRCGGSDTGPASPASGGDDEEGRTFLPEGSRCQEVVPPAVQQAGSADPNCTPSVESVEADLNQDGHMDIRRVYLLPCPTMLGEDVRPEIMCREADLNYDGRKDIFRHFRAGEAAYEEQDWNFDGVIDAVLHFAGGNPLSVEFDHNGDGRFEMQVLLQEGNVRRVKVDAVGDDHYDIYETYEIETETGESQLISIGYDLQGDGTMDRLVSASEPEGSGEAAPPATPAPGEE